MADAVNYGRIALLPEGEYSATKQYEKGDVVSYSANGASYICHTKPPVGTLPTNENYFQLCGARGEKGVKGDKGDAGANGNTPYIGQNGNWWIGGTDTGVDASIGIEVDAALSATSENPVQNKVIDAAIKNLSQAIEQANQLITNLQALRASPTTYGMTKVTDSSAVTDSTGLALAATEKNATIPGTLANQISSLNTDFTSGWKTNPNTYVPVTYGDGFEQINDADQIRCSKLNNGMRCITGALHVTKDINLADRNSPFLSVPDDFALTSAQGIIYQKWICLIDTSYECKAYNCLFSGNNVYGWGSYTIQSGKILSIHLLY